MYLNTYSPVLVVQFFLLTMAFRELPAEKPHHHSPSSITANVELRVVLAIYFRAVSTRLCHITLYTQGKNPNASTEFLPDRDRARKELELREQLKKVKACLTFLQL